MDIRSKGTHPELFRQFLAGLRIHKAIGFVWQSAAGWTAFSIVLLFINSIIPLGVLYLIKLLVDHLTGAEQVSLAGIGFESLGILILAAFGLEVLGSLCAALLSHANTIQTYLVADHMQRLVQRKSIDMDLAYYENADFYDKLHRAQREAPTRPLQIIQGLTELTRNGLTLVAAFVLLLTFHWAVVAAVLIASLPVLIYRLKYADALHQLQIEKTATDRLCGYFNRMLTTVDHAKEVRAFGFGPLIAHRFSELRLGIRGGLRKLSAQGAKQQFITESTAALAGYGALAFIVYAAVKQSITLGEMVLYIGAFQVASGSLRPTLGALANLYENNLFLSTLYEFLDVPKTVPSPERPKQMPRPWREGVRLEKLIFHYPGTTRPVLEGIDMQIRPGEIVALVGCNGSGKTTLTKLFCRLYDPDGGRIMIDGVDLRDFNLDDLRREMSVIYQDFGRYHMTARENILLGRPEIDALDPAIEEAAQWANIHDTLMRLPRHYETVLSRTFADGAELSIGQWQKLALARAFVRDSQLILLDEPTSALDAGAEFEFFEKFRDMAKGRSALIISHRFSTVRLADNIYVLDGGRIVEEGNHHELMAVDGLYANLYRQQASYYH